MKSLSFILSFFLATVSLNAQDYQISFAGTGASTTVGTVMVENLTQGKSLTLNGTEVLHLVATITGINPVSDTESELRIYPNPANGNSTIDFVATASGKVNIELYDVTGKRVGTAQNIITNGTHSYQVSNLRSGIYTVRISSQSYNYTAKLVSNGTPISDVTISYLGNGIIPDKSMKMKSANAEKEMQYNTGDRLKITGTSGNFSTAVIDVPTQSKSITFPFVACTDADGRNYQTMRIGSQTWMAENLAYLPAVSPASTGSNTIPYYYVYGYFGTDVAAAKNNTNYSTFGVLYNWPAALAAHPPGWHLPSDAEWIALTTFLGGENVAGGKLKESGYTLWRSPNASATNEIGFAALPAGYRSTTGTFDEIGNWGFWWSSTGTNTVNSWYRFMTYLGSNVNRLITYKEYGFSVRCVKD